VRVLFAEDVPLVPALPAGHDVVEVQPRVWTLRVEGAIGPLLARLAGLPVQDLEVQEPRLEDVLIQYYRAGAP